MAAADCTCAHCGSVIIPRINKTTGLPSKAARKFCSSACGESYRGKDRDRYVRRPHKPKPVECEHCKKTVLRRVRGGKSDAGRYCSRDCAFAALAALKEARGPRRKVVVKALETVKREIAALRRIAAYVEKPKVFRFACIHCSTMMIVRRNGGLHKQVCDPCAAEREKRARGIHKRKRKAASRGIEADSIDPIKVFERDKWRCHICGTKTLKKHRGTHHDRAPELEHIVALADGGTHTWGNVACACRICNQTKGAASFGQLGLRIAA